MKYFLHNTNAFNDDKICELFDVYGYEGLGLFYTILERIGAQEKPIKINVLKRQLQIGKKLERIWNFLVKINLISCINDEVFNERILLHSKKYQIKNEKNRENVKKFREQNIVNQQHCTNRKSLRNDSVIHTKRHCNADKEINVINKECKAIAAPSIIDENRVYTLLRTDTRSSIPDRIIKDEAKKFIKKYNGQPIGSLSSLISTWAQNINGVIFIEELRIIIVDMRNLYRTI